MQNRFIIVIPVYNAESWIRKCLESVTTQKYSDYEVAVVDDYSEDGTWDIIKEFQVHHYRNDKHTGSALRNLSLGIKFVSKENDIIVTVDGDDYLANDNVLNCLNEVYQDDIWLTYGSFLPLSGKYKNTCQPFSHIMTPCEAGYLVKTSVTPETYRKSGLWVTSHLRTFRRWLWDEIDGKDLRDEDGEYFKFAWDLAFMYPMIEMAGDHIKFIDKILYYYNDLNPNNNSKIYTSKQIDQANYIINKKVYARIDGYIL